jgi:hypothetical protein
MNLAKKLWDEILYISLAIISKVLSNTVQMMEDLQRKWSRFISLLEDEENKIVA